MSRLHRSLFTLKTALFLRTRSKYDQKLPVAVNTDVPVTFFLILSCVLEIGGNFSRNPDCCYKQSREFRAASEVFILAFLGLLPFDPLRPRIRAIIFLFFFFPDLF